MRPLAPLPRLARRLARAFRREDGTATLDFVIMMPVFVTVFLSCFEVGILTVRHSMLDRGVDLAVRDLRLGAWPNPTADFLKQEICSHTGGVIADCENQLLLELITVPTTTWAVPDGNNKCIDRDEEIQPAISFDPGVENQMVLIRACLLVDPFFPGTTQALALVEKFGDKGIQLVSTSGFVNEPGSGSE